MTEDVRIVFTAGTHWMSRLIRWVLRSPVSHVFIEYPSYMWGDRWVAEATKGGVRKVPAWKARKHVFAEFRCKFGARGGLIGVSKYVGDAYDYTGAVLLGVLALLWRWFRVKVRNPLKSSKAQFCSELVCRFLQEAGVEKTLEWDPEKSDPQTIYRFCQYDTDNFEQLEKAA